MKTKRSRQLHLLTRRDDTLARTVIERQRRQAEIEVVTLDLTAPSGTGAPDYEAVLRAIFAANSVAVW